MPQAVVFTEAERAEFERVVEAFAGSPRLAQLLRYMGEKLFSGDIDQLNEYNIATEALGRSRAIFNPEEDAIARVETHRLRKRLAEFYDRDGKNHSIQVIIPPRSYVPAFIHKPEEVVAAPSVDLPQTPQSAPSKENARLWRLLPRGWLYAFVTASLVLAAVGVYLYARAFRVPEKRAVTAPTAVIVPPSSGVDLPVRMLAGYSGPPRTDSAGRVWGPDHYFSAGGAWRPPTEFIARAGDSFLFEHMRCGDFSYRIPLKPGVYELHLFFLTLARADASNSFNISLNGKLALQSFDINSDALGENIADERIIRDVSPGEDGFLEIALYGVTGQPTLSALEILPGLPHAQLPIRLIMQSTPFTDRSGRFWAPDNYFMNGRLGTQTRPLVDSPDPDLFSRERYGHFTYALPVDTHDRYTLVLHFAELYFGPTAPGNGGVGSRVFNVICNGQMLLENFDIFREAEALHEVRKTFRHLKPSPQGKLNLTFEPIVNNATVSGIEVLDESQ